MKHPERFTNAIDALVKAFFNDHLEKGSCAACAVGNIIAHCNNVKLEKHPYITGHGLPTGYNHLMDWKYLFCTIEGKQYKATKERLLFPSLLEVNTRFFENMTEENKKHVVKKHTSANEVIESTGYDVDEMAAIEHAFETGSNIFVGDYGLHSKEAIMKDQYNGLMAVVDILCEIDNISEEDKAEVKEAFSYAQ